MATAYKAEIMLISKNAGPLWCSWYAVISTYKSGSRKDNW